MKVLADVILGVVEWTLHRKGERGGTKNELSNVP